MCSLPKTGLAWTPVLPFSSRMQADGTGSLVSALNTRYAV